MCTDIIYIYYIVGSRQQNSSERSKVADSGSFGRKIEFSSSFDKYKSLSSSRTVADSPSSGGSMMRRSSRASEHSLFTIKTEHDDDLEDFVRFVGSNQELRSFQNRSGSNSTTTRQQSSSDQNLSSGSDSSVSKRIALSHFQNLRDTHNSLSESLSSSIMLGQASSVQQDPVSGISPVSSTSSTGRSYQPIIPSPLHAEQRSTSPVHIPRSYPQLRSLTNNQQNPLRITRLNQPSQNDDFDVSNDMSAYSTYPQDHHHQDLHILRNAATTSNSNRIIGKATVLPQPPSVPVTTKDKSPIQRLNHFTSVGESSEPHLYNLQRSRNTDGGGSSIMQDNSTTTDIHSSGQGRTNSMMDDDDSLVFKMSELECEGPSQPKSQNNAMLYNNRYNSSPQQDNNNNNNNRATLNTNNDPFFELTPTPLSPPILNRLQAISMSTVTEEEERNNLSTSGSSNKSESSRIVTTSKPSQLPFDTW